VSVSNKSRSVLGAEVSSLGENSGNEFLGLRDVSEPEAVAGRLIFNQYLLGSYS